MKLKVILSNIIYIFFSIIYEKKEIILLEAKSSKDFGNIKAIDQELTRQNIKHLLIEYQIRKTNYIKYIRLLAKAKVLLIDSNSPASFLKISKHTILINCWHAGGAYKCVGFDALNKDKNIKDEINRIKRIHRHINYFICSSSFVAKIYQKAFCLNSDQVLAFGLPRLDNTIKKQNKIINNNNYINILYAPTFRTDKKGNRVINNLPNIKKLQQIQKSLKKCKFALRVHPSIKININIEGWQNWSNISQDEALKKADILITDYSSIFFDYMVYKKPIVFYLYDFHEYIKNERNLYFSPFDEFANNTCVTELELANILNAQLKNSNCDYASFWNTYMGSCDGFSTLKLCNFIKKLLM